MKKVSFKEASLFDSNQHLSLLPPVHDTVKTKILYGRTIQKLEGKNRKLRFVTIDEIFDWHNNIYQCNIINKYRQGAFDSKFTQADKCHDCAFAQRKACKHFACMAEERKDNTEVYFERI